MHVRLIGLLAGAAMLHAQKADPAEFFESKVRPLLANHCYACHTGAASGGLRLDSREALLKGGKSGPAVVPGKPEESLLIAATAYTQDRIKMPPSEKMEDTEIADLTSWVRTGAVWPETSANAPAAAAAGYQITPQQRAFWAFQPIRNPAPPKVRLPRWQANPIDAFVFAKLDEKKLTPAAPASKQTLIRRATLDLTGLPPTPQEVDAFVADKSATAYAKLVDRLLASPRYGERWGRHWLDVVRYSDTAGDASDYPIPQAVLYRDYVINSFNHDKPYDQFLREQLAGDLLPAASEPEKWEHTVATGYLAGARRFNVNPLENMHLTVDDTIDNFGKTVLGLSIACARCHDHKFDPIPNRDYYALYGVFQSTRYPFPGSEKNHKPNNLVPRVQNEFDTVLKPYLDDVYKLSSRISKLEGEKRAFVEGVVPGRKLADILSEIVALTKERQPLLDQAPNVQIAYAVAEGAAGNARIQKRGDQKDLGDEVPRGFLQILNGGPVKDNKTSGRLELANWATDTANPMPARVMVNRIWQYHFGRGLVNTPSDFGKRGTLPSNPELLDYLATQFTQKGWSVKTMHRQMMLSQAYQLASEGDAANLNIDAANEFQWKFSRQRMDAEQMRDSLLQVSGELELGPGGAHPFPHMGTWQFMQHGPFSAVYETNRRSVYLMRQRIERHPYLGMFDGADAALSTAVRSQTITPIQALFSMNSEFVFARAKVWAGRLIAELPDDRKQIAAAYRTAYGRAAAPDELGVAMQYLAKTRKTLEAANVPQADAAAHALASYLRVVMASNEFLFVD